MTTDIFRKVYSYDNLINANISFLNGEIPKTPYYLGSIEDETIPLVDKLVQINKNGFISIGGQPSMLNVEIPSKYPNRLYTYSQKSYIEGYIRKTYLLRLLEFIDDNETINKHGKFVYKVYDLKKSKFCCFEPVNTKLLYNSIPEYFPLSIQKRGDDYVYSASIPSYINPTFDFLDYPNIIDQLVPYSVYIIISATEFEEKSVEDLLIDFYKKN